MSTKTTPAAAVVWNWIVSELWPWTASDSVTPESHFSVQKLFTVFKSEQQDSGYRTEHEAKFWQQTWLILTHPQSMMLISSLNTLKEHRAEVKSAHCLCEVEQQLSVRSELEAAETFTVWWQEETGAVVTYLLPGAPTQQQHNTWTVHRSMGAESVCVSVCECVSCCRLQPVWTPSGREEVHTTHGPDHTRTSGAERVSTWHQHRESVTLQFFMMSSRITRVCLSFNSLWDFKCCESTTGEKRRWMLNKVWTNINMKTWRRVSELMWNMSQSFILHLFFNWIFNSRVCQMEQNNQQHVKSTWSLKLQTENNIRFIICFDQLMDVSRVTWCSCSRWSRHIQTAAVTVSKLSQTFMNTRSYISHNAPGWSLCVTFVSRVSESDWELLKHNSNLLIWVNQHHTGSACWALSSRSAPGFPSSPRGGSPAS